MTVLIVDDNEQISRLLRLLFQVESFKVIGSASDGAEACELALKHRPDFAILDYSMPGVNGEQAAACIRTLAPDTRIVAFSAVLDHKPEWADAYCNKDRVAELIPLLGDGRIKPRALVLAPDLTYLHALPGRLRLKIIEAQGAAAKGHEIQELLASMDGVKSVKLNARTGNALIGFDPQKVRVGDILRILSSAGFLAEKVTKPEHEDEATPLAAADAPQNGKRGDIGSRLVERVAVTTLELVLKKALGG